MSEHLPECYAVTHRDRGDDRCICPALRVCEERVQSGWEPWCNEVSYDAGHAAGVAAAREAVLGVSPKFWPYDPDNDAYHECITVDDALAAIDALRGESNG